MHILAKLIKWVMQTEKRVKWTGHLLIWWSETHFQCRCVILSLSLSFSLCIFFPNMTEIEVNIFVSLFAKKPNFLYAHQIQLSTNKNVNNWYRKSVTIERVIQTYGCFILLLLLLFHIFPIQNKKRKRKNKKFIY